MILNIYKPLNWTSFDIVAKLRGILKTKKIGHAGTLDPLADGVLVILTEKDTKKQNELMGTKKEYIAEIALGLKSDSYDLETTLSINEDYKEVDIGNKNLKKPLEKNIVHKNSVDLHRIKIENEQENFTILKIPKEISKEISEARNLKKITQKDMANRLNISKDIINNIENGKANYDPSTKENINKIQKFLGIKLKKIKK